MSVNCIHAEHVHGRPNMVQCTAGRYGGRPSVGTCQHACAERKPRSADAEETPAFEPKLKDPAHRLRMETVLPVCERCSDFGGMLGTLKVKCAAGHCLPCGISLPLGHCPKEKWVPALIKAKSFTHTDVTQATSVEAIRWLMKEPLPGYDKERWLKGFEDWENVIEAHRQEFSLMTAQATKATHPAGQAGRGILIVGGGKYFASAYVTIRVLRNSGCTLPIELWYLGRKNEMPSQWIDLMAGYGVRCVDGDLQAEERGGIRILHGWELKAFATLYCGFSEVIAIDADSYPVKDPAFLFSEPEYQGYGAIFWPDQVSFDLKPAVWTTMGLEYRDEADFESGQYVVDKARFWPALLLAHWMNQHSDFYYRKFWGDKSTFHLAARAVGANYGMPSRRWHGSKGTMIQHDMHGRALFYHRSRDKFTLEADKGGYSVFTTTPQDKTSTHFNSELKLEAECHRYLEELRAQLSEPLCQKSL